MVTIINTDYEKQAVEIDGTEYELAENTIETEDKLQKALKDSASKPYHARWRAVLEVLLGKAAVDAIFSSGRRENLDRMKKIYTQVMTAFFANSSETDAEVRADEMRQYDGQTRMLEQFNSLLARVSALEKSEEGVRMIRRQG